MIRDPHDKDRLFRQYVRFAADGSVASVHEYEASAPAPADAVEVTDLGRQDFHALKVTPELVEKLHADVRGESDVKADLTAALAEALQG